MNRYPLIEIQEKIDKIIFDAARDRLSIHSGEIKMVAKAKKTPLKKYILLEQRQYSRGYNYVGHYTTKAQARAAISRFAKKQLKRGYIPISCKICILIEEHVPSNPHLEIKEIK